MEKGLVSPTDSGAPQGGPLSPIISNIYLDKFDKELERDVYKRQALRCDGAESALGNEL